MGKGLTFKDMKGGYEEDEEEERGRDKQWLSERGNEGRESSQTRDRDKQRPGQPNLCL